MPNQALLIKEDVPLSPYSTFGIGGNAKFFAEAKSPEEMRRLLVFAQEKKIPFLILGKGSNTLFDDRGYNGLIILNRIQFLKIKDDIISVGSGYSFSLLGARMSRLGYGGLEFAGGIPGTVGGAIYMNAGAGGCETKDYLETVQFINEEKNLCSLPKKQLSFSYRFSSFQGSDIAIVSATFHLYPDAKAKFRQMQQIQYRTSTQPYKDKSCGCIFQNPENKSAGALIEQLGLKGKQIGGAAISAKHANFIINTGKASSKDVLELIKWVQKAVYEKTGEHLKPEIQYVPFNTKSKK